jgi:hypothetical protein
MREVTYHYGDVLVVWNQLTGKLVMFSAEGERIGVLPSAWSEAEVENMLRQEFGYVLTSRTVRPAVINVFPFP